MKVRQSSLKQFGICGRQYYYSQVLQLGGDQVGSLTVLGSVFHYAVDVYENYGYDIALAKKTFVKYWDNPDLLGFTIDFWHTRTTKQGLQKRALNMLDRYHDLHPWSDGKLIGTEINFTVPIGDHELTGTIDKLWYRPGQRKVEVIDFKTGAYVPVKLRYNIQFTAYCLSGETPVLMGDYSWKSLKEVSIGDEVVGFDEHTSSDRRRWHKATVQESWAVEKDAYEILFSDGRKINASADHRWLAVPVSQTMKGPWFRTDQLVPGMQMSSIFGMTEVDIDDEYRAGYLAGANLGDGSFRINSSGADYWQLSVQLGDHEIIDRCVDYLERLLPSAVSAPREVPNSSEWGSKPMLTLGTRRRDNLLKLAELMSDSDADSWKLGWLAGLYDTDGSLHQNGQVSVFQKDHAVLDRVAERASDFGFTFLLQVNDGGCDSVRLKADRMERVRFMSLVRPALSRKVEEIQSRTVRIFDPVSVVSVEPIGKIEMFDITTSSRTFVADGLLTHNCYATERPEFWEHVPNEEFRDGHERFLGWKRQGWWYHAQQDVQRWLTPSEGLQTPTPRYRGDGQRNTGQHVPSRLFWRELWVVCICGRDMW